MISVIIPLYNKSHVIKNTLSTVLNQTYEDFEVIIVDDGSTDDSVNVIANNFTDNRIRIICQKNRGVSIARNRGVQESKSEYIAFLDADDQWHPEYLEHMHEMILESPDAVLYCCAGMMQNIKTGKRSYRIANKYTKSSNVIDYFENPPIFSNSSSIIVKKDIFNLVGGFLEGMKYHEDFRTFQMIALHGSSMFCGWPLTKYMFGVDGQTTQTDNVLREEWVDNNIQYYNDVYLETFKCRGYNKSVLIYLKYILRHEIKSCIKGNDFNKLKRLLQEVILVKKLSLIEVFVYHHSHFLSLVLINITKLIWRFYRFPIVEEKLKNNSGIPKEYLNW